ncbi:hypothetical protein P4S72_23360 [Vibrio sp. PP-XX7]
MAEIQDEFQSSLSHGWRIELGHVSHATNSNSIRINAMLWGGLFLTPFFGQTKRGVDARASQAAEIDQLLAHHKRR